jgi:glycosyltransferase involved in cell wall biosynthesis
MPEWLISLDGFVLPSLSEGCPHILMEAMAGGLPCVATRVGAVPDLVEEGVSGLLARGGNAESLKTALEKLLALPDGGASLGQGARKRMEGYSPARERQEWGKAYRRVGNGSKGAGHPIPRRPLDTI